MKTNNSSILAVDSGEVRLKLRPLPRGMKRPELVVDSGKVRLKFRPFHPPRKGFTVPIG
jgi:hypothetical protein